MPFFHRDGIQFYFEEQGRGLPLVFSHPIGGNAGQMRALIGAIRGVRSIVYDNRGHGRTSGWGDVSNLTFQTMAADMAALLDHLSLESAVVGGVSMGAGIAVAFALRSPERVRALVLSRVAWLDVADPPNLAVLRLVADLVEQYGCERARVQFESSAVFGDIRRHFPATASSLQSLFRHRDPAALVATLRHIPRSMPFGSLDSLRQIRAPALILISRLDPIHPVEYGERLAESIPGAILQELTPKSESLLQHEADFRRYLAGYLARNTSRIQ